MVAHHVHRLLEPRPAMRDAAYARQVYNIVETRCEHDVWSIDARMCVMNTRSLTRPQACKLKLSLAQHEMLDRDLARLEVVTHEPNLPACARYLQRLDLLIECTPLSRQEKMKLAMDFDVLAASRHADEIWSTDHCEQALRRLDEAARDTCGWN